ncbi:MAG: GFA family protein [Variovorax sp.]|nr:MAG: GFA family protein [Variovorax sp.]
MSNVRNYKGSCFCGAVQFTVSGDPAAMGYCHCDSCRRWSAAPVNSFTLWPIGSVSITEGADKVDTYSRTPQAYRKWCKTCGGHIFTEHPSLGLTDVAAVVIADFAFEPGLHVNYGEAVLHMKDGLVKMKDIPKEMGGSGVTLPE